MPPEPQQTLGKPQPSIVVICVNGESHWYGIQRYFERWGFYISSNGKKWLLLRTVDDRAELDAHLRKFIADAKKASKRKP